MSTPVPPPSTPETLPIQTTAAPNNVAPRGSSGCLWFLGGSVGCLALLIALLFALVLATGNTITNFIGSFTGSLSGFGVPQARTFYVPSVEPFTALTQLTTIRYNYSNQVNTSTDMPAVLQALYGNSQVIIAVGSIEAGIDMSAMDENDILYDAEQRQLTLRIPAAQITNCYLNDQQTYIAERTSGLFAADSTTLDTESRRFALRGFLQQALEGGILPDAQAQAALLVRDLATTISNASDEVRVVVLSDPVDENVPLPETCQ